jgi:biopolymer transport protein TolQ
MTSADPTGELKVQLDFFQLITHAPWPVKLTVLILCVASLAVWLIGVLKLFHVARLRSREQSFEARWPHGGSAGQLFIAASSDRDGASGARVVVELQSRRTTNLERLRAAADRVIVDERQRARSLLTPLGSIASSAPFIGLFGTVYGIMDAFMRIGAAKSASLPVVAPAIGEALITTAIGLAVAIPAVVFYNAIDKRVADFVVSLEASAAEWVALIAAPGTEDAT